MSALPQSLPGTDADTADGDGEEQGKGDQAQRADRSGADTQPSDKGIERDGK